MRTADELIHVLAASGRRASKNADDTWRVPIRRWPNETISSPCYTFCFPLREQIESC